MSRRIVRSINHSSFGPALCFAVVLLTGCETKDKLVHSNYDRIRLNATSQDEVKDLIGDPDNKLGDLWMYNRPDAHLTVMIDFDEKGQVTRKQWIDAMNDDPWTDSSDHSPATKAGDRKDGNH